MGKQDNLARPPVDTLNSELAQAIKLNSGFEAERVEAKGPVPCRPLRKEFVGSPLPKQYGVR